MKVGEALEMKGPFPKLPYKPNMRKNIAMIAGGTGITPMLQVRHYRHRHRVVLGLRHRCSIGIVSLAPHTAGA